MVTIVSIRSMWCFFCKQKTAYEVRISDWSSDECSSDLLHADIDPPKEQPPADPEQWIADTLARIAECPTVPRPSYIGRSGNGLHLLWKLDAEFYIGGADAQIKAKIGRASCRERVCQDG